MVVKVERMEMRIYCLVRLSWQIFRMDVPHLAMLQYPWKPCCWSVDGDGRRILADTNDSCAISSSQEFSRQQDCHNGLRNR